MNPVITKSKTEQELVRGMPKYLQIKGIVPIQIKNNKYTEVFSSYVSKDFLVID
jgi:hypothetical protein